MALSTKLPLLLLSDKVVELVEDEDFVPLSGVRELCVDKFLEARDFSWDFMSPLGRLQRIQASHQVDRQISFMELVELSGIISADGIQSHRLAEAVVLGDDHGSAESLLALK